LGSTSIALKGSERYALRHLTLLDTPLGIWLTWADRTSEKFHEHGEVAVREYLAVVLLAGFVILNGVMMIALSHLILKPRPTPVKGSPYESGIPAIGTVRERFSVKFYLIAMLFIVFDIETVFLIPWGVAFRELGLFGLVEMAVFILILLAGYAYAWMRGALEWD
jgi:NADH-quinone oxidoreductase subunit A